MTTMKGTMVFRKWYYLLYPLLLPHTLIGLLLALFYRPSSWRWSQGCLEAIVPKQRMLGQPDAQTHGCIIYYASESDRGELTGPVSPAMYRRSTQLRVHERVHVYQGLVLGPTYPVLYGLTFLVAFAKQGFKNWWAAYMKIPFEKQAYRIEGEYVNGKRLNAWGS